MKTSEAKFEMEARAGAEKASPVARPVCQACNGLGWYVWEWTLGRMPVTCNICKGTGASAGAQRDASGPGNDLDETRPRTKDGC
jgi:DnaJ-class molecular chaperone